MSIIRNAFRNRQAQQSTAISALALMATACASTPADYATQITTPIIDMADGCAIKQTERLIEDRGGETSIVDERTVTVGYDASCLQAAESYTIAEGLAEAFFVTTFEQTSDPSQVATYGEAMLAALYGDNPYAKQAVENVLRENSTGQSDIATRVNEARRQMEEVIRPRDCTERRGIMPNGEEVTYNDCRTITGSLDTRQLSPTSIRFGHNFG